MAEKQTSTLTHAEHLQEAINSIDKTPGITSTVRGQMRQSLQIKLNNINKENK